MEKKNASKELSRRDFLRGSLCVAGSLFCPPSVSAFWFSPSLVFNKTTANAKEFAPGYLEKNADRYNLFLAKKRNSDSYVVVADVKDSEYIGRDVRAYIEDADLVTLDQLKYLKGKFGIEHLVFQYQVHGMDDYVKGKDDYALAFVAELKNSSRETGTDILDKLYVSPKTLVDNFTMSFDKKVRRNPFCTNEEMSNNGAYHMYWAPDVMEGTGGHGGGDGGGNGGGGVGGDGGAGGSAGG